jgi:hypothetical protein
MVRDDSLKSEKLLRCANSTAFKHQPILSAQIMLTTTLIGRYSKQLIYFTSWLTLALASILLPNLRVLIFDPDPVVSFCAALILLLGSSILLPLEWNKRQQFITRSNRLLTRASYFKEAALLFLFLLAITLAISVSDLIFSLFTGLLLLFLLLSISMFIAEPLLRLFLIKVLEREKVFHHLWITNTLAAIVIGLALFNSTLLILNYTGTITASLTTNRHIYYLTYTEAWDDIYGYTLYQCDRYDLFCKDTALDLVSNDGVPHGTLQFDATKNQVIVSVDGERRFIKE